jgi:hypothetical protein
VDLRGTRSVFLKWTGTQPFNWDASPYLDQREEERACSLDLITGLDWNWHSLLCHSLHLHACQRAPKHTQESDSPLLILWGPLRLHWRDAMCQALDRACLQLCSTGECPRHLGPCSQHNLAFYSSERAALEDRESLWGRAGSVEFSRPRPWQQGKTLCALCGSKKQKWKPRKRERIGFLIDSYKERPIIIHLLILPDAGTNIYWTS